MKLKCFHLLYAPKQLSKDRVQYFVALIVRDMAERGKELFWDSDAEEEREVFSHDEASVRRVLRTWVSCTIVPFLTIIEPYLLTDPIFKRMKRVVETDNAFNTFAD
jgi:hypothetical protein